MTPENSDVELMNEEPACAPKLGTDEPVLASKKSRQQKKYVVDDVLDIVRKKEGELLTCDHFAVNTLTETEKDYYNELVLTSNNPLSHSHAINSAVFYGDNNEGYGDGDSDDGSEDDDEDFDEEALLKFISRGHDGSRQGGSDTTSGPSGFSPPLVLFSSGIAVASAGTEDLVPDVTITLATKPGAEPIALESSETGSPPFSLLPEAGPPTPHSPPSFPLSGEPPSFGPSTPINPNPESIPAITTPRGVRTATGRIGKKVEAKKKEDPKKEKTEAQKQQEEALKTASTCLEKFKREAVSKATRDSPVVVGVYLSQNSRPLAELIPKMLKFLGGTDRRAFIWEALDPVWASPRHKCIIVDTGFLHGPRRLDNSRYVQDLQLARDVPWIKMTFGERPNFYPLIPEAMLIPEPSMFFFFPSRDKTKFSLLFLSSYKFVEVEPIGLQFTRIVAIGSNAYVKIPTTDALISLSGKDKRLDPSRAFYNALQNTVGTTDGIRDFVKNGIRIFSEKIFQGLSEEEIIELMDRTVPILRRLCFIFVLSDYERPDYSLPTTKDHLVVSETWREFPLERDIHVCLNSCRKQDIPYVRRFPQMELMKQMRDYPREYDALYYYKSCHGAEVLGNPVSITYEEAVGPSQSDYIDERTFWKTLPHGRYGFGFYDMCQVRSQGKFPHSFVNMEPAERYTKSRGAYVMIVTSTWDTTSSCGFNNCSKFTLIFLACHPNPVDLKPTPFTLPNKVKVEQIIPNTLISQDRVPKPIRTEGCILDAFESACMRYTLAEATESELVDRYGTLNPNALLPYTPRIIEVVTPVELETGTHRIYRMGTQINRGRAKSDLDTVLNTHIRSLSLDEDQILQKQTSTGLSIYSGIFSFRPCYPFFL